jgi:predicted nucleic acid-binding Zn ribbon protein
MPPTTGDDQRNLQDDYNRRQIRLPPPKSMGSVLSQLLAKRGYAQLQSAAACQAAWRSAVGEKTAASTRAGEVRRGVLEVIVATSAVVQELTFVKAAVIKKLTQLAPEHKIRDLRFRVGPID